MSKRKHAETADPKSHSQRHIKVSVAQTASDIATPVLVTFPGTQPPSDTVFMAYKSDQANGDNAKQLVFGETEKVSFSGANFGEDAARDVYCKYVVGRFSKKDNTLTLSGAPVLRMRRKVKAIERAAAHRAGKEASFSAAKASLGLAFGTEKARKQLRDEERNAVDGSQLENDLPSIHEQVNKYASSVPTQSELSESVKTELPIPTHNLEAETPEEAYDLSSIVTEQELLAMNVKDILKQSTIEGVAEHLPFIDSSFVNDRILEVIKTTGKKDRQRLRTLVYISHLMAYFCKVRPGDVKNRRKVEAALQHPSVLVLNKLADRYTVSNVRTSLMSDKILCYLVVLCLSVADYSILIEPLAKDLSIRSTKLITVCKNLGCKIEKCTNADAANSTSDVEATKKATLVTPLKFPDVGRGKRK